VGGAVKFLFTCARGVGLWDGGVEWLVRGRNCYGLTWDEERVWYSCTGPHSSESFVEKLGGGRVPFPPMENVHAILWGGGRLWATDTGHDRVAWWDSGTFGSELMHRRARGFLHLNSLWAFGDGRVGVLSSGLNGRGGDVLFPEGGEPIHVGPKFYHDFCVVGGWLYGNYKKDEASGMYRTKGGKTRERPMPPGSFMRGLATDGETFLFGRSESKPRPERPQGDSRVVVTDAELNVREEIVLKDTGQVCALRLAEGDLAHNGLPFPGRLSP